jgi:hypothetical protein
MGVAGGWIATLFNATEASDAPALDAVLNGFLRLAPSQVCR